ncbi:MAG TPA: hypothetical protein VEB86_18885 [Chryseosolibacter sp.]|nr:hypothetical protein [Chryseosolibacter sp.]
MKRPKTKLIALFFGAIVMTSPVLTSCDKDDSEDVRPKVEIPTEFSELTVEQNKENLEDNGIALVGKMTSLKDAPGINTTASLNHFLSIADVPEGGRAATNNKAVKMMILLSRFGIGNAKASDVLKGFRAREEEPQTPQEVFNEYKGTYTFNHTTQQWDYAAGGDAIIFKFPSTENGTTNNAELSIYGYTTQAVVNDAAEYDGDVPTALKADLSVNGTKQIEYSWAASYKNNGEPTSIVTTLKIGTFLFAFEVKNTTSEIGINYSLTENGTNLLSFGAGASGNFNSDNIGDSEAAADVVTSSSAYFQIMNIKFAGEVQVKTLEDALDAADTIEEEAAAYNAGTTFVVFYADSKEKIADLEFYGTTVTEEYDFCFDQNGDGIESEDECEHYTDTYEKIDVRLVFADQSKTDLETYTDVGFEEFEAELDEFTASLEEDFGG